MSASACITESIPHNLLMRLVSVRCLQCDKPCDVQASRVYRIEFYDGTRNPYLDLVISCPHCGTSFILHELTGHTNNAISAWVRGARAACGRTRTPEVAFFDIYPGDIFEGDPIFEVAVRAPPGQRTRGLDYNHYGRNIIIWLTSGGS